MSHRFSMFLFANDYTLLAWKSKIVSIFYSQTIVNEGNWICNWSINQKAISNFNQNFLKIRMIFFSMFLFLNVPTHQLRNNIQKTKSFYPWFYHSKVSQRYITSNKWINKTFFILSFWQTIKLSAIISLLIFYRPLFPICKNLYQLHLFSFSIFS